jgi:hypothetical protein
MTAAVLAAMPKGLPVSDQKKWLLSTIKTAGAAANDAKQNATTAQAELVSRIWSTLMAWLRGEFSLGRREFRAQASLGQV